MEDIMEKESEDNLTSYRPSLVTSPRSSVPIVYPDLTSSN